MKYVYGKRIKTLKDRMVTFVAAAALFTNSAGVALPFLLTQRAAAATATVTPLNLNGWSSAVNDGAAISFEHDASAPSGDGALRLTTASNNDSRARFNKSVDVKLTDVTDISFVSKLVSGPAGSANASFRLGIDNDGNGTQDQSVVYETYYNFDGTNTSNNGNWQVWNVKDGKFWGSWNGGGGYATNTLLTAIPNLTADARIKSISVGLGNWNPSWNVLVDSVSFNGDVHDFEPEPYVPTAPPTMPTVNGTVIYSSVPSPLPSNSLSLGYQATSTAALGDKITFAGSDRNLKEAAVTLSSWACETGNWNSGCVTTPGATFNHPVTLNIYNVAGDGTVGSLIDSRSQTFEIPYRPTADPTCGTATQWRDTNGNCFNGLNHVVVFDVSGITVPDTVIYSIAYNTNTYGADPIGASGPYESLNVSLSTTTSVGTNVNADEVFWDTTYPGYTAGLKADSGWASDGNPAVMFTAIANTAPVVTFVGPTPAEGSVVSGMITPHVLATDDYGMGSYYIRLWKGAFESGIENLVSNNCSSAPGAFLLGTNQDITCPSIDTTTLDDGTYVLSAQFQDGHIVWGQALRTFTVDNSAPNAPNNLKLQIRSTGNFVGNNGWTNKSDVTALWDSNNTEPVTYEYQYWNDVPTSPYNSGNRWTNSVSSPEYAGVVNQGDGKHYFCVVAIDAAGHRSACSTPFAFNYDGTNPVTDINVSPVVNGVFTVSGDASDNLQLNRVYVQLVSRVSNQRCGGTTINLIPEGASASWSRTYDIATLGAGCPEGLYAAHVAVVDMAGNTSSAGWTNNFLVEAPAPVAPAVMGLTYNEQPGGAEKDSGDTTYLQNFVFTIDGSETVTRYQLKYWNDIPGSPFKEGTPWNPTDGSWSGHMSPLGTYTDLFTQGYGVHYFSFSACDALGNCSDYSAPFVITYAEEEGEVNGCDTDNLPCTDGDEEEEEEENEGNVVEEDGNTLGSSCDNNIRGQECDPTENNTNSVDETLNAGQGGQVLAATTGLAGTGTQNGGILMLLAAGLLGFALLVTRRKQQN